MTNQELDQKLKSLAAEERMMTKEIIWHIAEVERRKLYLAYAYPSLFAYLTECIGYSEGAAQRRIDAARLTEKVPRVAEAIGQGKIHLAQVSKVQKIIREIKKQSGKKVDVQKQKEVFEKLESKNSRETDFILSQEFNIKIEAVDKKKIQQNESVRVEMTFSKEEMEILEHAKALLSNQTGGALKESILAMARKTIKDSEPKNKTLKNLEKTDVHAFTKQKTNAFVNQTLISTATVAVKPGVVKAKQAHLKSTTPRLKREIRLRDQVCQFIDPKTKKQCGSRYYLEVDHIQPRFLNGLNTQENLRLLCKSHNLYRYKHGI